MHPVLGLFRHNAWATRELLTFCAGLPPEVLQRSDPDVYGSIEGLFNHILGAEARYLGRLGPAPEPAASERAPLPLADLLPAAEAAAAAWEARLLEERDPELPREHRRGDTVMVMPDWVLFVQAVHHGQDHRTQVNTLLSRQGIAPPDLDGWTFGELPEQPGDAGPATRPLLIRFLGHHLWAVDRLMKWYLGLPDPARELGGRGTYGSITDTFAHLLMSDRTYLARLGPADWPSLLTASPDFDAGIPRRGGLVPAWVIAVQAVQHGNDHRTHVGTIALANHLECPDVDVWSYAVAEGVYAES